MHLTETWDDGVPNLITNVQTTTAAVSDDVVTSSIHASLDVRGRFGVDLVGPTRGDRQ